MAFFRILLGAFLVAVTFLAVRYMMTGQRRYLRWAAWLIGLFLASGAIFFAVLLLARLV